MRCWPQTLRETASSTKLYSLVPPAPSAGHSKHQTIFIVRRSVGRVADILTVERTKRKRTRRAEPRNRHKIHTQCSSRMGNRVDGVSVYKKKRFAFVPGQNQNELPCIVEVWRVKLTRWYQANRNVRRIEAARLGRFLYAVCGERGLRSSERIYLLRCCFFCCFFCVFCCCFVLDRIE